MKELGVDVKYYRPPWGHCNIFTNYEVKRHNLTKILWDVMAQDWEGNTTADIICDKLLRRSKDGSIKKLHYVRCENESPISFIVFTLCSKS